MQIEIITVGSEILSGRTVDTNFAFLARALEAESVQVAWHCTVGDAAERIGEALARALGRADAVVLTGGLGPTPDDLTRKAVSTALGRPLQLDERVLQGIRERIRRLGRKLPASVETQALLPFGAEAWPNSQGTAPGILLLHGGKPVILLPGVPHEMEALATEHLVPYLRRKSGRHVETFTLRTAGAFETQLQERIGAAPQGWPGVWLAYLPSYFGVDLRVTAGGLDAEQVRAVAARAYTELTSLVGPVIYAEGAKTMEAVLGETLTELGFRLAVAESCTGGLLAKRVTDTPGASRYFERGFVTYSNPSKVELLGVKPADLEAHGAVSAPVAEQMAAGARRKAGVEVGLGVTGIAGPEGGSDEKPVGTVLIAVSSPGGEAVRKYHFAGTRPTIRERAAQTALDLARRHLRGLPLEARLE
ncbi:MAG TPA: competence/damage-inducible protein A [Candidatus Eisenbacteria bacterium]|jgi:nicotinamide-nucleotide amidase